MNTYNMIIFMHINIKFYELCVYIFIYIYPLNDEKVFPIVGVKSRQIPVENKLNKLYYEK